MKILGHGEVSDSDIKPLTNMVRGEGFDVFVAWLRDYGVELSVNAVRTQDDDDATGKLFVVEEIADGFRTDVEAQYEKLGLKYQ